MGIPYNGYSQRGWNGVNATVTPNPGAILLDSGVIRAHAPTGSGFDLADFETPLQICPINPHEMKPSFSTKDWEELGLQDSHAFEGKDVDDPDNTYYFSRAVALVTRPPSIWTGKMRLFMQCLYGSHNKKTMNQYLEIELQGQDDNKSTLSSLKLGTFELSSDVILYTDEVNYRYFLIRIGVDSAEIAEIIFDEMGDKVLNKLRNDPDFSETPLEQVEGFLFSRAKEVDEPVTVTGFDINSFGVPLWHWFHANKSGHSAAMVPIVQTGMGYITRVCELDFSKVSEPNQQEAGKWIDTWSIALRVSRQSGEFCPLRVFDNIWVGTTAMFHPVPHIPGGGPLYCFYKNDVLKVQSYGGGDYEPYQVVDSGWGDGSMDSFAMHCGLPNDARQIMYRANFRGAGFTDGEAEAIYSEGMIVTITMAVSASSAGDSPIGSSDEEGGCDQQFPNVVGAPGVRTHPAINHLMAGVRVDTYQYSSHSGSAFLYIPLNDAEACFMGSRSDVIQNTPDMTITPFSGIYSITHFDWRPAWPAGNGPDGPYPESPDYGTDREHVGDSVGAAMTWNSTTVPWSPDQVYIPGVPDPVSTQSGAVFLLQGGGAINVAGHASLFTTPIYGNGSTGFAGYVQQSALTGKAVYSSGDGLAGDALCDGSPMGYYDIFTGLV